MKKIIMLALSTLAVAGLAACGGGDSYSDAVLATKDGSSVHAVGGWTADNWVAKDTNKMDATSIKAVSELSKDVADKLAAKEVEYLYMKEVTIGTEAAGWDAKCKKDGKIYSVDGSYTVKALQATYDNEEQTYIAGQWIPDPHTAHAEALNDAIFFPTWVEAADEDGFAWDQNPVVIGGAGVYTQIVAKYKAVSAPDVAGFGMAMIMKTPAAADTAQKFEEYVAPSTDSYGICGTMNEWGSDEVMTQDGDVYKIRIELAVDAQFKVRLNAGWDTSYGFDAVDSASPAYANFADEGGNVKVVVAGKYDITFNPTTAKITVAVAAEDTYGIVGSMTNWDNDIVMAKDGDVYSATVALHANDEFKVRMNAAWDTCYGIAALDPASPVAANFAGTDNIVCTVDGEYVVSFNATTSLITITAAV